VKKKYNFWQLPKVSSVYDESQMKIQLLAIAESQLPKSVLQNSCFPKKAVAETQQHQQKLPVAIDLRANGINLKIVQSREKILLFFLEIQIYSELTGEKTASFAQLKEDEQELLAVGNQSTIGINFNISLIKIKIFVVFCFVGNESDFKHYIREDAAKLDKVQATSLDTTGKGDEQKVLAKLEEKTALLARLEEDLKKREDLIIQTAFEHTVGRIKEVQSKFVCHHKFVFFILKELFFLFRMFLEELKHKQQLELVNILIE
jgi:hypothetical protein